MCEILLQAHYNPCDNRVFDIEWSEFVAIINLCELAHIVLGALAQLARAPALQAGGPGFESPTLHHMG